MGRTNPVGARLRYMINWPSNVFHPTLRSYIKHLFQHSLIAEPGIRSSTSSIWINVTLLSSQEYPIDNHPLKRKGFLDFSTVNMYNVMGRLENNVRRLVRRDPRYASMFSQFKSRSILESSGMKHDVHRGLQIFKKGPIHLRLNVISNPLLNAEIAAQWVAKRVEAGANPASVYRELLNGLSTEEKTAAQPRRKGNDRE